MKVSNIFRSKYLKAVDLEGKTVNAEIMSASMEQVGETLEEKLVVYFSGKDRGLILNKTNAMVLASSFGDDTDRWTGKTVQLFTEAGFFQGKQFSGLRVRVPDAPTAPVAASPAENLDDDIPF